MKKQLYIQVDYYESQGPEHRPSNQNKYFDGWNHNIIYVRSWGPIYFSLEGKNSQSHSFKSWRRFDAPTLTPDMIGDRKKLYIIVFRYSDGDTFGKTEGNFEFGGVFLEKEDAIKHMHKNKKMYKEEFSGWMVKLESSSVEEVEYRKESEVLDSSSRIDYTDYSW